MFQPCDYGYVMWPDGNMVKFLYFKLSLLTLNSIKGSGLNSL